MTHKKQQNLHEGKALAGAALGAFAGWSKKRSSQAAATSALLGGLAALFAGSKALDRID